MHASKNNNFLKKESSITIFHINQIIDYIKVNNLAIS
jgi:hypothetical protein